MGCGWRECRGGEGCWGQRRRRPVGRGATAAGDTTATAHAAAGDASAAADAAAADIVAAEMAAAGDAAAAAIEKDRL